MKSVTEDRVRHRTRGGLCVHVQSLRERDGEREIESHSHFISAATVLHS